VDALIGVIPQAGAKFGGIEGTAVQQPRQLRLVDRELGAAGDCRALAAEYGRAWFAGVVDVAVVVGGGEDLAITTHDAPERGERGGLTSTEPSRAGLAASARCCLSNRVPETCDDIVNAACDLWKRLIALPKTITPIGSREWTLTSQP
jgi:hypothetical protein